MKRNIRVSKPKNDQAAIEKFRYKKISAIVLVGGNMDEVLFKKCLDSLNWCDEILKVETSKVNGSFADWRNFGAVKAEGEWLFYVDSDEEISAELRNEILNVISREDEKIAAYAIPRKNIFLGHVMEWGGWSPDYVLRLIRKDRLTNWIGDLHEQPEISGTTEKLKNKIIHRSHRNLSEMLEKTNEWSAIEAKLLFDSGHPKMNFIRFVSAGFREFWHRGIKKLGFLDGGAGIVEIIFQTFSRLITYMKLWELQLKQSTITTKSIKSTNRI